MSIRSRKLFVSHSAISHYMEWAIQEFLIACSIRGFLVSSGSEKLSLYSLERPSYHTAVDCIHSSYTQNFPFVANFKLFTLCGIV